MHKDPSEPKRGLGEIFREIPNWIKAIAALIAALATAGFFAVGQGHAPTGVSSPPADSSSPRPGGHAGQPAPAPTSGQPASGAGVLLTQYSVDISADYGINFGTSPVQPESCDAGNFTANLCYGPGNGITSNEKLAVLPAARASYQGCKNETVYVNTVATFAVGTRLCFTGGTSPPLISSATITAIGSNPAYVRFKVEVWEGT